MEKKSFLTMVYQWTLKVEEINFVDYILSPFLT